MNAREVFFLEENRHTANSSEMAGKDPLSR
jgi:hypothetical protein